MDDETTQSATAENRPPPSIDVRGLGFALTAAALRALLDPATRGEAEVSLDLSALAIDVPAVTIDEVAKRVAPGLAVEVAPGALIVRLPSQPAVRVTLPAAGVRVQVGDSGVRLGSGGESGGG